MRLKSSLRSKFSVQVIFKNLRMKKLSPQGYCRKEKRTLGSSLCLVGLRLPRNWLHLVLTSEFDRRHFSVPLLNVCGIPRSMAPPTAGVWVRLSHCFVQGAHLRSPPTPFRWLWRLTLRHSPAGRAQAALKSTGCERSRGEVKGE